MTSVVSSATPTGLPARPVRPFLPGLPPTGPERHQGIGGEWVGLTVPAGSDNTDPIVKILEVRFDDFSENADTPEICFAGDGQGGCEITSEQLRDVVARGRLHLDRLDAMADQFDAMTGAVPQRSSPFARISAEGRAVAALVAALDALPAAEGSEDWSAVHRATDRFSGPASKLAETVFERAVRAAVDAGEDPYAAVAAVARAWHVVAELGAHYAERDLEEPADGEQHSDG